jgi:hypothetical protein
LLFHFGSSAFASRLESASFATHASGGLHLASVLEYLFELLDLFFDHAFCNFHAFSGPEVILSLLPFSFARTDIGQLQFEHGFFVIGGNLDLLGFLQVCFSFSCQLC